MGFFNFKLGKKEVTFKESNFWTKSTNAFRINDTGILDLNSVTNQLLAYMLNPVLRAVIDRRAEMLVNGRFFVEIAGEESKSKEATKLKALLASPNGYDDSKEFMRNISRKLDIHGEVFILPFRLGLNEFKGFTVLENQNLEITMDYNEYPFKATKSIFIKTIFYTVVTEEGSNRINLTEYKDDLIIIRSSNNHKSPTRGISKLLSIQNEINKITVASIANLDILANYGAMGFLSNNTKDQTGQAYMLPRDKEQFEGDYLQKYGLTFNKKKLILTGLDLKYVAMTKPLKELMLHETLVDGAKNICEVIGYKFELLAHSDKSTYNNVESAEKAVYDNFIHPHSVMIYGGFKSLLLPREEINVYFDHLACMQESEDQKATRNKTVSETYMALLDKGIISIDEAKKILIEKEVINE